MSPNLRAALLVVVSCAFFAGASAVAKALQLLEGGSSLHPLQITFSRFLFGLLAILPVILARGGTGVFRTGVPLGHGFRVLAGVTGATCVFAALAAMPLAEVTAISWASPLFALVFAAIFLGERVDRWRWAAAAAGFAGVIVMTRPGEAAIQAAALLALAAAVLIAGEVTTLRALAQRDRPLTVLAISNAGGAALSLLAASPVLVWPSAAEWPLLAAVGVLTVSGQWLFVRAMALGEASFVAPFSYATLLYAALFGYVFFAELPALSSYVGAALIVGSGILIMRR